MFNWGDGGEAREKGKLLMKIQFYFVKTLLNIYASAPELKLCEKGSEKIIKIVPE